MLMEINIARERANQEASDLLATTTTKMSKLVKHLGDTYPEKENVKYLVSNYNPKKIMETLPTSEYTHTVKIKGRKLCSV